MTMTGLSEALVNLGKGIKIIEKLIAVGQQVLSLPLANMSARLKLAIDTLKATEEVSECLSSEARNALKYGKNPETNCLLQPLLPCRSVSWKCMKTSLQIAVSFDLTSRV